MKRNRVEKSVVEKTIGKTVEKINEECVATFHADDLLLEMAQVGHVRDYKLIIWTNDNGQIPHFHVIKGKNPGRPEVDSCIKIYPAEYYPHNGHTDKLPRQILEEMVELLSSEDSKVKIPGWTYWKSLINAWNQNNERRQIDIDTPMPDYSHIKIRKIMEKCYGNCFYRRAGASA